MKSWRVVRVTVINRSEVIYRVPQLNTQPNGKVFFWVWFNGSQYTLHHENFEKCSINAHEHKRGYKQLSGPPELRRVA